MFWVRVDNRLVHGQVIEGWLPYLRAKVLVVLNDDLAGDALRQEIMGLAIPPRVEVVFGRVEEARKLLSGYGAEGGKKALALLANCQDALAALETGLDISSINIGNLHYGPGKTQICTHAAVSEDDIRCLSEISGMGVELDFRCIPSEQVQVKKVWN